MNCLKLAVLLVFSVLYPKTLLALEKFTELENVVQKVAEKALLSTVSITATSVSSGVPARGAGILVDATDQLVITSYHIVDGKEDISVNFHNTSDKKKSFEATLLFSSEKLDLALLKINSIGKLPSAISTNHDSIPRIGQFVLTIGSPGGYDFSLSLGLIGSVNRRLDAQTIDFLQVDNSLSPGSSGGPVLDMKGNLLGIISRGGANGAAGFAVPIDKVKFFLDQALSHLKNGGKRYGYLGAVFQPLTTDLRRALNYQLHSGLLVAGIYGNSTAHSSQLQVGDVILQIDNIELNGSTEKELEAGKITLKKVGPGQHRLVYFRDGKKIETTVTLSEDPPCKTKLRAIGSISARIYAGGDCFQYPSDRQIIRVIDSSYSPDGLVAGDIILNVVEKGKVKAFEIGSFGKSSAELVQIVREGNPRIALAHSLK